MPCYVKDYKLFASLPLASWQCSQLYAQHQTWQLQILCG